MKVQRFLMLLVVTAICILLTACTEGIRNTLANFMGLSEITQVTLAIAVPYHYVQENTGFLNGIELARSEIEDMDLPIKLNVQIDDDGGDFSEAVVLAQTYIANESVIGVVGHWTSNISESIVNLYVLGKTPLIVPTVSASSLTEESYGYIFKNIPSEQQIGRKMCNFVFEQGGKSAVIYYEDSMYGFLLSTIIEKYADSLGIKIIDRVCQPTLDKDFPDLEKKWSAMDYDTVFVVSNVQEGAAFINKLRTLGYDGQIVCSDEMDSESLTTLLKDINQTIVVCSIFNDNLSTPEIKRIQQDYIQRFGKQPDVWALQGYDCVKLVANAIANHNVRTKEQLAEYFQNAEEINSIFGKTYFDKSGQVVGKQVYLKIIQNGASEFIN